MVGVVVGSRLGLEQTSGYVLGSRGQLGSSSMGRAGENVFVNAATGNLILSNRDEFLVGLGINSAISRTYNSQGQMDGDNNDGWRIGASRRVSSPTGTLNTVDSTVTRTDWDGSQVVYTWDAARSAYLATEGAGSYDTLEKVGTEWVWTDGDSRTTETYAAAGSDWRIVSQADTDANTLTFAYTAAGYVSRITTTTADGKIEHTDLSYSNANLTELATTYWDKEAGAYKTLTRTRYAYDASNRLSAVTVDLSPENNLIGDGKTYVTTYTYDGTSTRIASISQTDGSRVDIAYEAGGAYRVTSIVQTVATGVTRSTAFTYVSATRTDVTGPDGLTTSLEYDAEGQLTRITEPAATAGGAAQVREFSYDSYGNVTRIQTSPTTWTIFVYNDTNGDGVPGDHNGLWTRQYQRRAEGSYLAASRTYDARNAVLTETRYLSADPNPFDHLLPDDPLTTRYVYDSENHLRYTISPTGSVVQYDYSTPGNLVRTIAYTEAAYTVAGLATTASVSEAAMIAWAGGLPNPSAAQITETIYDHRGNISRTIAYSTNNVGGGANGGFAATGVNYVYDQAGQLLSRNVTGMNGTETFVYDGMGRLIGSVDFDGGATTTAFHDALGTTVVRLADGLNQISTFNRAGERISYTETERGADIIDATGWPMGEPPPGPAGVPGWPNIPGYAADSRWSWTMVNGPNGRQVVAMETGQIEPGENGGGAYTNASPIRGDRAYEYVFYFRKADLTRHSLYFGMNEQSGGQAYVESASTGVDDPNPYFFTAGPAQQQALLDDDRWYKVVAYVLPQGSSLITAGGLGGVYDAETGVKVADVTNYRWNDTRPDDQAYARFFNYYDETEIGYSTYFLKPEVRQVPTHLFNTATTPSTQYRYDNMGRLRTVIDPTGVRSHALYDRVGRKVADIDGDGSLIEYRYDLADRLVSTTRYATWLTPAQIAGLVDAAGNPTGVELAAVRPTATANDSWAWQVYDDAGRLTRTVDGVGGVVDYRYDGASRLMETRAYSTAAVIGTAATFDATGAVVPSSATGDRVTRRFHDADGRQIGTLDAEGYLTQIHYDRMGRVIQTSAYANLTSGNLRGGGTFEQLKTSAGTHPTDIRTWSVYDGRGFLKASVNGEGEVTLYEHTPLGHIAQIIRGRKLASVPTTQPTLEQLTAAPATVLETTTYTRNHLGQVLTESRALADGPETTTYTYDSLHRLVATFTDRTANANTNASPDYGSRQRYDARGRMIGQLTGRGTAALLALGANPTAAQVDAVYRQWGVNYAYDEAGRLISRTDPDGVNGPGDKTTYFYDADGNLAYQVNPLGETTGYAYDPLNRRTRTITYADRLPDPGALKGGALLAVLLQPSWSRFMPPATASLTSVIYNTDHTVSATVDPLGAGTAYVRNVFGENIEQHTPTTATDGEVTLRSYDRRGLLTSATKGAGFLNETTSLSYDAFGRVLQTTDPLNAVRLSSYDRAGRAKVLTDALGYQTIYDYDARGNVLTVTDRLGKVTSFTHDAFNRTQTVVTSGGLTTITRTDDLGHTLQVTDGGGRTTTYAYDLDGQPVTITNGLGQQSARSYDTAGRLFETTDATGRKVRYGYDGANRILSETVDPDGLALTTTYAYDAKGQRTSVTDASGVRTDYAFDNNGRVTSVVVDPTGLNLRTEFGYDRAGNIISQREGVGTASARETLFEYDKLNRLTRQRNADAGLGIETRYEYDRNGNVTRRFERVSAGVEVASRFAYDAENQLVLTVDPAGGVMRNIYDAEGQLIQTTGFVTRLTPAQIAGLPDVADFTQIYSLVAHSNSDQTTKYFYDGDGRLTFIRDAVAQVTRNLYDGSNNVIRQIRYAAPYTGLPTPTEADMSVWAGTAPTSSDRITRNVYDAAGRQTFSLDALGQVTAFTYDAAGRTLGATQYLTPYGPTADPTPAQMATWSGIVTQGGDRTMRIAYDGAGRATFMIDAEGYATRTEYRADGQVARQSRYSPVLSVATGVTHLTMVGLLAAHDGTASRTAFGYDAAGRTTSVTDAEGVVTSMALDALGRVTETILAAGTSDQSRTTRVYDDAGRLTSETRAAGEAGVANTSSWTYDGMGRMLSSVDGRGQSTQYTYDSLGRVLTKTLPLSAGQWATTTNTYDVFGNLVSVTDPRGAVGSFEYDRLNRQVRQTDPLGYVTLTSYSRGGEVISVTRAGATTTFGRDKLDRLISVTDAQGHVEGYILNAFGDRISVTNKVGGVTTYQFDRRGLMTSELLPITSIQGNGAVGSVINLFEYDSRGNLTKTVEAASLGEARTAVYVYDKLDRLVQKSGDTVTVTNATNFTTTTSTQLETIAYDRRGNVIQTVNADGARTLFYYDDLNRKISEIDALGTVREWTYDANDNAVSARVYDTAVALPVTAGGARPVMTGARRETLYQYDLANRLTHTTIQNLRTGTYAGGVYQTSVASVTTENRYDAAGNVTETIDGRGVRTYAGYDLLGRQVSMIDGEGYLTVYNRNADGNVTQEVRYAARMTGPTTPNATAGDRITNFTYDLNGRRLTETRVGVAVYATGSPERLTTIDAQITYTYDGLGNVITRTEANGDLTAFGYDLMGRQIRQTGSAFVDYQGNSVQRRTTTAYNGWSGVTRMEEGRVGGAAGDARVTTFVYGAGGRLAGMTDPTGFTRSFGHDAMGRVVRESYDRIQANDVAVTEGRRYGYDLLGRLTLESAASLGGSWTFGDTRSSVHNAHGEITARALNGVVQETFDYDQAGRIWRSTAGDGVAKHMMYDAAGRVTLTVLPGGGGLPAFASVEALVLHLTNNGGQAIGGQAMTSATLTYSLYDGRGLLLGTREPHRELARDVSTSAVTTWADIVRSRAYNAFGEVVSETDGRGNTSDFTYNTMGRLIEQRSPEVQFVNEQGVTTDARPTLQYRYDVSGRLIATRTANGHWSSRTLVAGTGHGQDDAVVARETAADGGVTTYGVDVFGDIRKITNPLGFVTEQDFDKAGRLITVKHQERAANTPGNNTGVAVRLIDSYAYDGLGQRIQHWNNQYGPSYKERTLYDREGRVVSQTDLDGWAMTYSYVWDANLTTTGLGIFGGWNKTTTHASGKIGVEKLDGFGRLTGKTDLGGRTYVMGFDQAGRMVSQTSSGGQSLTMSWYNTGLLARQSDISGNAQTYSTANAQADYSYDEAGNRLRERYVTTTWTYDYDPVNGGWNPYDGGTYTPPTVQQMTSVRQDGWATYDKLGRMIEFRDTVISATDPTLTTYTYDLNGNVRSTSTRYRRVETDAATTGGHVYWYGYDAMDRFVHAQYSVNNGVITGGTQFLYDAASNRRQAITHENVNIVVSEGWEFVPGPGYEYVLWDGEGTPPQGYQYITHTQPVLSPRVEYYDYTADGYLAQVRQAVGEWDPNGGSDGLGGVVLGTPLRYSEDRRDAMGRVVERLEYADGATVSYSRLSEYSRAGLIERETTRTLTDVQENFADYHTENVVTYDYRSGTGSGAWTGAWQGVVTRVTTTSTKVAYNGTRQTQPTSRTTYAYSWWDSAQQATLTFDSDTGSGSNPVYTSTFGYDVNGRLSFVNIKDGRPRNVTFVTDAQGQVLTRREADSLATDDPFSQYYYFNGQRIGETTNDAAFDQRSYSAAVIRRTAPPSSGASLPFQGGVSNFAIPGAGFDYGYEGLRPDTVDTRGQAWTVRDGDTLQGIAAAVWGDASLWYLIAEHNGLTGASILSPGQRLTVPAKVANLHNTTSTFRPYDPNKALGDLNPTQPAPPKKPGGCGVLGQIIAVVIAVAVTYLTQGALAGPMQGLVASVLGAGASATTVATVAAVATAATAAAAGSVASQGFLMATGAQDSFDWKQLGITVLTASPATTAPASFARAAVQAAARNVVVQGVAVATGLQHTFDWTGVAVAAVVGGVSRAVGGAVNRQGIAPTPWSVQGVTQSLAIGTTAAAAGAATRSALTGSSFGDNLIAALPDVIGATIGNAVAGGIQARGAARRTAGLASQQAHEGAHAMNASDGTALSEILDPPGPGFGPITELDAFIPRVVNGGRRVTVTFGDLAWGDTTTSAGSISDQEFVDGVRNQFGTPTNEGRLPLRFTGTSYVGNIRAQEVIETSNGNVANVEPTSGIYVSTPSSNQFVLIGIDLEGTTRNDYVLVDITARRVSDTFSFSSTFGEGTVIEQLGVRFEVPPGTFNGDPIGQVASGSLAALGNTAEGTGYALTHPGETLWSAVKSVGYAIDIRNRPQDVRNYISQTKEIYGTYSAAYQARGAEGVADVVAYRVGEALPALIATRGVGAGASLTRTGLRGAVQSTATVAPRSIEIQALRQIQAAQNSTSGIARNININARASRAAETVPVRLAQDLAISPKAPSALPLGRPIGLSPTQNASVQADIIDARAAGGTRFRVNQQQVDAAGNRVGINRPDLQYTDASGRRVYIEYDTPSSTRGPGHQTRIMANDFTGTVILKTVR